MTEKGRASSKKVRLRGQRFLGLLAITALLLLAGCGTLDTDVTLYKEERWKAKMELYLLPGTVSMIGGESAFESDMEDEVPELREKGINLSWSKKRDDEGGVTYYLAMEGEGWQELNEAAFNGDATITTDESGQVHFSYYPQSLGLVQYTLCLRGGKIISSNADRVEDNSAIWRDPSGRVEAVLTEASAFDPADLVLPAAGGGCCCLGVIVVLGALVFFLWRRRDASSAGAEQ